MHPIQVLGLLASYYRRLLRLDDSSVQTSADAIEALGGRVKEFPARKALEAARILGTDGIRQAFERALPGRPRPQGHGAASRPTRSWRCWWCGSRGSHERVPAGSPPGGDSGTLLLDLGRGVGPLHQARRAASCRVLVDPPLRRRHAEALLGDPHRVEARPPHPCRRPHGRSSRGLATRNARRGSADAGARSSGSA